MRHDPSYAKKVLASLSHYYTTENNESRPNFLHSPSVSRTNNASHLNSQSVNLVGAKLHTVDPGSGINSSSIFNSGGNLKIKNLLPMTPDSSEAHL